MTRALPSLLTLAGCVAAFAGVLLHVWPLLLVSLALDVLDGTAARFLGAVTDAGARFDWTVDASACGALLACMGPILGALALVPVLCAWWVTFADWQVNGRPVRVSGRTLCTALYLAQLAGVFS